MARSQSMNGPRSGGARRRRRIHAAVLALGLPLLGGIAAGPAQAVPSNQPGLVANGAHTRVSAETISGDSGLAGSDFWTETINGANEPAESSHSSSGTATSPSSCPTEGPCAGWNAVARGRSDVVAGVLEARGSGRMWIHAPGCCGGAAGYIFVDGAALIDDTITLSGPATVTLRGRLEGAMGASNNDSANQGNDPDAELNARLEFTVPNEGPCGSEWCPPHQLLGGYSEDLSPEVGDSVTDPATAVDEPFEVEVDLPAGTSNFSAALVASLDYQVFGYADRLVDKHASLDFDETLSFEIVVPAGVDASSGSGDLPIVSGGPGPEPDDTTPPETTITKAPKKKVSTRKRKAKAKFKFRSSENGSSFRCKLDKGPFRSCSSPWVKKVPVGRHRFQVRAVDSAGNVDPTAAKHRWKVVRKRR